MTFEQQWHEYDFNPFIIFNSNGKIKSLNTEAQFLLGCANQSELFELATTYASVSFGFKTTFVELEFGRYSFFGLTVGYENEEEIGIKLYKQPSFKLSNPKPNGELANVFTLIDLCISTNSINSNVNFINEFDPTIPDVIIDSNSFIKILNKIYSCYIHNDVIKTKVFYRIGEHIKFDGKKYSIFSVRISADNINTDEANKLNTYLKNSNFYVDIQSSITINIPMITSS
jgi:hypothetical protein